MPLMRSSTGFALAILAAQVSTRPLIAAPLFTYRLETPRAAGVPGDGWVQATTPSPQPSPAGNADQGRAVDPASIPEADRGKLRVPDVGTASNLASGQA